MQSLERGAGGKAWVARAKGGDARVFDAVVLCMPPKDALRITGAALGHCRREAKGVQWHSRFSLALWWRAKDAGAAAAFTAAAQAAHQAGGGGGGAAVLDAVVVQSNGPAGGGGGGGGGGAAVVVQSTPAFWLLYSSVNAGGGRGGGRQSGGGASAGRPEKVAGGGRAAVLDAMVAALERLAPRLKMPRPAFVKMLNWKTSQVKVPHAHARVAPACLARVEEPGLVVAGDWCAGESSFEGCAASALAAVEAVEAVLSTSAVL